jgi:hypothetical protein
MATNPYVNKIIVDGVTKLDLTADTVQSSDVASGKTFHDATGAAVTGTSTLDSDTSDDTALVSEILSGKTAHARGAELTGTMPNNGAISLVITTANQVITVPLGFHDGSGTVQIDATEAGKLIAGNIKQGVTILGVTGTHSGQEELVIQTKNVTPSFSAQAVTPDSGYDYLAQVNVAAIPVTETDNAAGGKTVTVG